MTGAEAGLNSRISFLTWGFNLQSPVFQQQPSMEIFSMLLLFLVFKFGSHVYLSLGKGLVCIQ